MDITKYILILTLASAFYAFPAMADNESLEDEKVEELKLEDIFQVPVKPEVKVASKKALTIKDSPGIVSLITDKEILNSGARDLKEVLELIPGISFHHDVQGGIGIAIRGLWAHEGKALVILDGQEMNDTLFSTILFNNHFPVDQIKRVEILRGAGSAIYGGQAELAVINIVTKSADDLNGFSAKTTFDMLYNNPINGYTHRNLSLSYGQKFGDLSIVTHGILGLGNTSDKEYKDFSGNSVSMLNNQNNNLSYLNIGLNYKDFSARLIGDLFRRTSSVLYDLAVPKDFGSINVIHDGYYGELKYNFKPLNNLTITPKLNFKRQYPWVSDDDKARKLSENKDYSNIFYSQSADRYVANLTVNSDVTDNINLIGGAEYYYDIARANDPKSANLGKDKNLASVNYNNLAIFAQGLYKNDFITLTLGSRFENHSAYGPSFVPRFSVNAGWEKIYGKLLLSRAFKAPSIINISNFNPVYSKYENIKPENTTVLEMELGYDITDNLSVSANGFDIGIQNPIVYFYDEAKGDSYDNFDKTGTRGVELELSYKDKNWGYSNISYSYYRVSQNTVDIYKVDNRDDVLLAMPNHKVTFTSNFKINDNFSINPSLIFFGERYGYTGIQKTGETEKGIISSFSPTFLLNLNLLYKDFFTKGLNISLTGINLLNQTYNYIQPYNGSVAPLAGPSTQFALNLQYNLPVFANEK